MFYIYIQNNFTWDNIVKFLINCSNEKRVLTYDETTGFDFFGGTRRRVKSIDLWIRNNFWKKELRAFVFDIVIEEKFERRIEVIILKCARIIIYTCIDNKSDLSGFVSFYRVKPMLYFMTFIKHTLSLVILFYNWIMEYRKIWALALLITYIKQIPCMCKINLSKDV